MGGEHSHHCATPALPNFFLNFSKKQQPNTVLYTFSLTSFHICKLFCSSLIPKIRPATLSYIVNKSFSIACVGSVPVRAECYVSRASEDSGRAKNGARAKKGKEQNLRSHVTHSTSLPRERLLRRLLSAPNCDL